LYVMQYSLNSAVQLALNTSMTATSTSAYRLKLGAVSIVSFLSRQHYKEKDSLIVFKCGRMQREKVRESYALRCARITLYVLRNVYFKTKTSWTNFAKRRVAKGHQTVNTTPWYKYEMNPARIESKYFHRDLWFDLIPRSCIVHSVLTVYHLLRKSYVRTSFSVAAATLAETYWCQKYFAVYIRTLTAVITRKQQKLGALLAHNTPPAMNICFIPNQTIIGTAYMQLQTSKP
jgi:hypothetical protein